MRLKKIGLAWLTLLMMAISTSIALSFPGSPDILLVSAQTPESLKAEADRLLQQGVQQYETSQFEAALLSWQQALKIYRQIKNRQREGGVLGNLGVAYDRLGDYPKAIEYLQQSLKIAREIKDRLGEVTSLRNLGNAYYRLADYSKAIEYYQQLLKIARETKAGLGEVRLLENYKGLLLENIGYFYYKQGNLQLAQTTLFESVKIQELLLDGLVDEIKVSALSTQRNTYRILQQVLIAQNKSDAALEIAERSRARAFVELLASKLSSNPKEQLSTLPNINQIKQIAKVQNATLVQYSIIYDDFNISGETQWKESSLYIWVIKPTGEITFRKADLKPLWQQENTAIAELVTTSRESIGVRGRGLEVAARPELQAKRFSKLHKLLIEPIADLLPNNPDERVIFVPQHELFLVPFAALQDSSGKYLVEKHTILTAPSIQVLELTRKQRQSAKKTTAKEVLVIGNPTMPKVPAKIGEPPQQLDNLPGALKEAQDIASLFKIKAITGQDATKATLNQRLPQARIVHLATHGLLDQFKSIGYPGAIALAPTPTDDGLLTSYEIMDLKLNAELVVLSACDTGRGEISDDGVIGLSRSFISAGAPSVIVSLWSVPDSPTASLMTEFYKNLQTTPNKAKALRLAMLKIKQKHPNPRDWAAFTLIGEAE